jgi:putative inorganic carbon (HCO3(-)) transporter
MLRTIFLLPLFAAIAMYSLAAPFAGVLGWTWITLMAPHQLVWGSLATAPINMVLAVTTLIGWMLSREPKGFPVNLASGLWLCFMAYMTFTTLFALAPEISWERWDRTIKIMALGLVVAGMATNQIRIHALVWVIVLSLAYFGVKGGIFTLMTGGGSRVVGVEVTGLGDNNYLALALCTIVPLMNYLRMHSKWRSVRIGAVAAMGLVVIAIIGTYSRGGLIGLAITCGYLWWKSRQKILIALLGLIVAIPAIQFMPESWHLRMSTIESAEQDASFQGRLQAWQFAVNAAVSRPFTGAGFSSTESTPVFNTYYHDPSGDRVQGHAAHSIYFQVLGDHGFIGLALYLGMLATTWWYLAVIRRASYGEPQLEWAQDLAAMMQVSLVAFMVAGAALSMAYYDMLFLLMGMSIALRQLVLQREPQQIAKSAPLKARRIGSAHPVS